MSLLHGAAERVGVRTGDGERPDTGAPRKRTRILEIRVLSPFSPFFKIYKIRWILISAVAIDRMFSDS